MTHRIILALAVSLSVLSTSFGQTQPPAQTPESSKPANDKEDVVRITTNLVQVDAVVLKDGKPVKDLTAADFEIYEDGRKQEISSFAYISNVPKPGPTASQPAPGGPPFPTTPVNPYTPHRTIALVIDDLGLSAESMSQVRRQVRKFVSEQLQPNDLVAIMRTGGALGALQQFTNDRRITDRAVNQIRWNICSRVGVNYFEPAGRFSRGPMNSYFGPCGGSASLGETLRALKFIVEAMGELPGRKSMIVFSDSIPREEQDIYSLGERARSAVLNSISPDNINYNFYLQLIAERAIRSSVVIYGVDAAGLQYTGLTAADQITATSSAQANAQINALLSSRSRIIWDRREGADLIARQTGGFLVRNSNNFELDRIMEEQSGYYLIGYRPAEETFNKRFHRIKAKVKRSGVSVRTRFGFYGITEEEANRIKRTPADQATVALMSPFGAQQIELDLTAFFADEKEKGSFVRSFVYLNVRDLKFEQDPNGWQNANVEMRGIVFGDNGVIVNQVTHDRTLSFRGETFQTALRDGLSIQFDIPVKRSGSFQVRVAARDLGSGYIGSAGQVVVVPNLKNHALALSGIVLRGITDSTANSDKESAAGPAIRRYSMGQSVGFTCVIYNALIDRAGQPNVVMQARLYRDAKEMYTSPPLKVAIDNQPDLTRLIAIGLIRLDPKLEPGNYYLQLTISDQLREKEPPVVQWIDFEIVK